MIEAERGIVLGPYFKLARVLIPTESFMAGNLNDVGPIEVTPLPGLIDPTIRRSILYFDYIDWPKTKLQFPSSPTYAVLEEQGFLVRSYIDIPQQPTPNTVAVDLAAHRLALERREAEQPGMWTFAHLVDPAPYWGQKLEPTQPDLIVKRGIEFELYDILPVPAPDVPFAEILDFKDRRQPELLAMRRYLDEIYDEIVSSGDLPKARLTGFAKLDRAIFDLVAAMRTSKLRAVYQSLRVDVLLDIAKGASIGGAAAAKFAAPVVYGAGIGGLIGLYKFVRKEIPSSIDRTGPLSYLACASSEHIISSEFSFDNKNPGETG